MTNPSSDEIFQVLGSKTRRDILSALASEPMYFNQLSKKVGIGQQSMLRHMKHLEDVGFVKSYDEKSDLGAPDRKFYCLDSSFILSVSSSKDEFSIKYNSLESKKNKQAEKLRNKMSSFKKSNDALDYIQNNLSDIDKEISKLESRLQHLHEVRQVLLHKTNDIGKSDFTKIQRKVLYDLVTGNPKNISSISHRINENNLQVKNALDQINIQLENGTISKKAGELLV